MFPVQIQRLLRFPVLFLFLSGVVLGSFCMGMFHSSSMHEPIKDGAIQLTQADQPCCGSTYLNRVAFQDSLSLAAFSSLRDILALLGLGLVFSLWGKLHGDSLTLQKLSSRIRWLAGKNPDLLFDPLKLAFAQGILNPKIY